MKKHASATLETPARKASSGHRAASRHPAAPAPGTGGASAPHAANAASPARHPERPAVSPPAEMPRVRFGYFHPDAREVFLVGSFNNWNPQATPLQRDSLGDWSVELALPRGEYRYRLMVDGEWRDDKSAQQTSMNPFGGFDAIVIVT